ncbi:unnamed protein product, partial [Polarella glacialis]
AVRPSRFHSRLSLNASRGVEKSHKSQQDAQEFLLFILNALHEEFAATGKAATGESFITNSFQGQLLSSLACSDCGHTSETYEDFFHLSVTIQESVPLHHVELEQVLAAEFALEERLEGENRWHCERCGVRVNATRKASLHRLPQIIVLHLKRFAFTDARKAKKVRTHVTLPAASSTSLGSIDFGAFVSTPQVDREVCYDIVSIVNHHGRDAMCGHYTAHCRHCVDGRWYVFDDDRVEAIRFEEAWLPQEAYMVWLQRRSPSPKPD